MSRESIREYIEALRGRYCRAGRTEKGRMLTEAMAVTGYHRKTLVRLLRGGSCRAPRRRRGRHRRYGQAAAGALKEAWEMSGRICSQRLQPFLPELIRVLRRHGEWTVTPQVEQQVLAMSPATMDRLLRPHRRPGRRFTTTKPGSVLKGTVPIRTFAEWKEDRPGFLEADLVAHCGESPGGFFLHTLSTVDVATGWVECEAVWGKGQQRVGGALHHIAQRLPFPLLGLDSDNGSEFLNHHLYDYCRRQRITFTRSRPYQKNDSAHVEQKNGSVVRRLVGYDRYSSRAAFEALHRLYGVLRWYVNFFQPVMKLRHKTRHGAKVRKVYDTARTPYQRLLESGALSEEQRARLATTYNSLNPRQLLRYIDEHLDRIWSLAERNPAHVRRAV